MPPKRRACSCKEHANFSTGQDFIVHRINARVFKKKTVQHLIDRSYIMKHSTFLCTSCAAFAEKNFEDETPSKRHKLDINDVMDNLQFMDDEELSRIAFKISQLQQLNIKNDIRQNLSNSYKDDVFLSTFNVNDWVSNRNRILNSFVSGLSGGNENIQTQALIVDLLYYYVSSRYISPIYFAKNLMIYFTTGSKAAVDIFSDEFPSGCYKTILNWIDQHAENKNECPPDVDVATYFDNNQVLEKKWNVTENYTANCSVITNLIHIIPSCVSKIQYNKELSPTYWRYIGVNNREKMALELAHQIKKTNILFRQHRDEFINVRMKKVLSEQKFKSQRYTDYIDENAACPEHVAASERYTFVDSKHPATSVTCVVGEPCYENPCSYESIQMVFDHILDITVGEDKRQWSVIGCDALPYTLGSRLIENIFSCECQEDFN